MEFSEMLVLLYLQRVTNVGAQKRVQNIDSGRYLRIFARLNATMPPAL